MRSLPPQVRYFIEVARCGSIREASEQLNIAPSALSRQIKNLEHGLGMRLFERLPRGMSLTSAGEIYARFARNLALEADRVQSELEELRGLRRGIIRIATIEGVISDQLTNAISRFRAQHHGIRFSVLTLGTDNVIAAVREGNVDLGISFNAQPDPDVAFVRRVVDPVWALVHREHALAQRSRISLVELATHPVAIPELGFGIRRLLDEQCRRLGVSILPALETNSIEALRGFARSGAGVSLIPSLSFRRDLSFGWVASIPLAEPALRQASTDISVLAGRRLPSAVTTFLETLREVLAGDHPPAKARSCGSAIDS